MDYVVRYLAKRENRLEKSSLAPFIDIQGQVVGGVVQKTLVLWRTFASSMVTIAAAVAAKVLYGSERSV